MIKTQDTSLRSASSRRESSPKENLQAKTIGCMPGIIRLLSKYHSSRKFLTFGKKQDKNGVGSSSPRSKSSAALIQAETKNGDKSFYLKRLSCNVPRSPTLPAEIRRSNSVDSPHICRNPPALVARLMGLEEGPQITPKTEAPAESASSQTRQQLLGALDKCDQDLKELKKIIDAVRAAQVLRSVPADRAVEKRMQANGVDDNGIKKRFYGGNLKCLDFNSEQPSPVSVLDESTRSPFSNHHQYYSRKQIVLNYGRAQTHQQRQQQRKKPGEEDLINIIPNIIDKITTESLNNPKSHNINVEAASSPLWNSRAMIDSVAEVCRDIAWGEMREIGRIGLALQEHICKELIEELVTEYMGFSCVDVVYSSLPFEACKRRLRF